MSFRGWRRASLPALLCVAMAGGPVFAADSPEPVDRVGRARVCMAALDFGCAEAELAVARAGMGAMDDGRAGEVLRLSAEVALSEGRRADAIAHLHALFAREPGFAPEQGAWPEAWRAVYEEARRSAPDRWAPELVVQPPERAASGRALVVEARTSDPAGVARVTLFVAADAGAEPIAVALVTADGERWRGEVPAELVREPALAIWVEAWDRLGNGPARWGDAGAPRSVPVGPPVVAEPEIYETWWFWTAVGVVVVGGGVAAWLLLDEDAAASEATTEFGGVRASAEVQ